MIYLSFIFILYYTLICIYIYIVKLINIKIIPYNKMDRCNSDKNKY
jgi:hypothetical protein